MMKLTQCLIVKNEEQNLPRALSWGKSLFDELIVVDTGSSDGTIALAEKLGAKVLHFEWIDDFSAARNFAISQCTGKWIFFLDADEYFEDVDVPLLRPLIEKVNRLHVNAEGEKRWYNAIETPWINVRNNSVSKQTRIFKNVPYLRYDGEMHEHLHALSSGYLKVYSIKDSPAIYHTGYVWSENGSKKKKAARYWEIARKALEKSPDCSKIKLFAAEALMFEGKYSEAERYFFEAMRNSDRSIWPERAREGYKQWIRNYMHMENSGAKIQDILVLAVRVYSEAVAKFPDDPDFDVLISLLFFKAKDINNTIRFFSNSLSKNGGKNF
jgi:glycosyltransferase involved in cell wall biosynthesis